VALVLLLPRQPDGLPELEKQLTGSALSEWLRQLKPETVTVTLPRFAITAESDLKQPLAQFGMPLAFRRDGADFTGLCSNEQPFALSSVAQQVSITVDEAGTEAHAATGIRSSRGLASLTKHEFRADRPFVFLVRDMRTDASCSWAGSLTRCPRRAMNGRSAHDYVFSQLTRSIPFPRGDSQQCSNSSGRVPASYWRCKCS
jgi:serpin B